MVHPPMPPQGWWPWQWIFRVQVAAALVLARLDKPWASGVHRRALLSLANGPMDWTTDAALLALTTLAQEDPAVEAEVAALFRDLLAALPQDGPVCYTRALLHCLRKLPGVGPEEREALRRRLRELSSS
jgi:hypothetical protein